MRRESPRPVWSSVIGCSRANLSGAMWLRDMLRSYARGQGLRRKTTTLLPGGREIFSGTEEERTKKTLFQGLVEYGKQRFSVI